MRSAVQCEIESMAIFGIRGAVYARSHTNKIKRKKRIAEEPPVVRC